jgi:hypothetical protein
MWLAGLLPHYFVRMLVFPDSEKDRLTQAIIPRPLREFHWQTINGLTQRQRFISERVNPFRSPSKTSPIQYKSGHQQGDVEIQKRWLAYPGRASEKLFSSFR